MKTFPTKKSVKGLTLRLKCVQTFFLQMVKFLKYALSIEMIRKSH